MFIVEFVIVQTLVFVAVLLVLRRMMIKDTASAVNRLKLVDTENAGRLEEMKKRIAEAEGEYRRRSEELAEALAKQGEAARLQLEEEKTRALAMSREEGERIIDTAKGRAERIDQEIEREVRVRVAALAGTMVQHVLSEQIRDALNEQLIDELLEELVALDIGHIPEQTREVEIVLPRPPSIDLKKRVKEILEKKLSRMIEVKETVKQEMIGGMILRLGSLVMDGSLDGKLNGIVRDMKKQI